MEKKYADEVDIISIVYLLRKLKVLMRVVLTNQQQFLLNFDPTSNLIANVVADAHGPHEAPEDWLCDYNLFIDDANAPKVMAQIDD